MSTTPKGEHGTLRATGIIEFPALAEIGVLAVPDRPGVAGRILGALANAELNVPFVAEITDPAGQGHVVLCVAEEALERAVGIVESVASGLLAERVVRRCGVAVVAVHGPHFRERAGCAAAACAAIASVGVNILAISTSVSSIAFVLLAGDVERAVAALQEAFGLDDASVVVAGSGLSRPVEKKK